MKVLYKGILISVCGVSLVAAVVIVLVLRNRNLEQVPEPLTITKKSTTTTTAKFQDQGKDTFSPAVEKERENAVRLEKTLPVNLRDTWTPEFKTRMEAIKKNPLPTATTTP